MQIFLSRKMALLLLSLLCLTILFALLMNRLLFTPEEHTCRENLSKAVEEFVQDTFPGRHTLHSLAAFNDLLCEDPEDMANVVILVNTGQDPSLWGMFHIHFDHTGALKSTVSFNKQIWQPYATQHDWHTPWCAMIENVYPDELAEQHCSE